MLESLLIFFVLLLLFYMDYIFLTTEIHTFCIDFLKVDTVAETENIKKIPLLENPLITFYYFDNKICPVFDLGTLLMKVWIK